MTLPPTSPSKPYSQVRSQLGTGDLVFLHGTSDAGVMIEKLEELAGWPPYSHVGMVINDGDDLYLWDARVEEIASRTRTATDPDNRIYKTVHTGCRVSVLDDVLAYYATKVDVKGFWVRQLTSGVSQDRFGALRRFINRVDGQPFPTGPGKEPDVSGLGLNFAAGQDKGSLFFGTYFCAQLVADSYMHMGLLAMEAFPANGYSPAHFGIETADFGITDPPPFVPGVALGPVFFVTWDRPTGHGTPCEQEVW